AIRVEIGAGEAGLKKRRAKRHHARKQLLHETVFRAPQRYRVEIGAAYKAQRVASAARSEEHTSELQSRENLVCRLLLEKKIFYISQHVSLTSLHAYISDLFDSILNIHYAVPFSLISSMSPVIRWLG